VSWREKDIVSLPSLSYGFLLSFDFYPLLFVWQSMHAPPSQHAPSHSKVLSRNVSYSSSTATVGSV
jgi:hypothetical protein